MTKHCATKEEKAQTILSFVNTLVYDNTIESAFDYIKYPLQTLIEDNGDCEDIAILAASLMKTVSLDVLLIDIPPRNCRSSHLALGVNGLFFGKLVKYLNVTLMKVLDCMKSSKNL